MRFISILFERYGMRHQIIASAQTTPHALDSLFQIAFKENRRSPRLQDFRLWQNVVARASAIEKGPAFTIAEPLIVEYKVADLDRELRALPHAL